MYGLMNVYYVVYLYVSSTTLSRGFDNLRRHEWKRPFESGVLNSSLTMYIVTVLCVPLGIISVYCCHFFHVRVVTDQHGYCVVPSIHL